MSKQVKISDIKAGKTFYMAPMNISADGTKTIGEIYLQRYMSRVALSEKDPLVKMWFKHSWNTKSEIIEIFKWIDHDLSLNCCKSTEYKRYKDAVKAQQDFLNYHVVTKEELRQARNDEVMSSFDPDEDEDGARVYALDQTYLA